MKMTKRCHRLTLLQFQKELEKWILKNVQGNFYLLHVQNSKQIHFNVVLLKIVTCNLNFVATNTLCWLLPIILSRILPSIAFIAQSKLTLSSVLAQQCMDCVQSHLLHIAITTWNNAYPSLPEVHNATGLQECRGFAFIGLFHILQ